jgi:hypothetical protein
MNTHRNLGSNNVEHKKLIAIFLKHIFYFIIYKKKAQLS